MMRDATSVIAPVRTPPPDFSERLRVFDDTVDHGHVQARLGVLYGTLGAVVVGLYLLTVGILLAVMPARLGELLASTSKLLHLALGVLLLGVAALCRGRVRPRWLLAAVDVVGLVGTMSLMSVVVGYAPGGFRAEFLGVSALLLAHTLRAALVPTPPRWTALVAALSAAPVPLGSWLAMVRDPAWNETTLPRGAAIALVAGWCLISVAVAFVVSRVVYGLRAEVKSAMRLGQYTLEAPLGEGGMGVVYRARHALLRRPVAIKLLAPSRAEPIDVLRFEREVQLTAMLTHPNTISIHDFGRTKDGVFYYVMELLDGMSLQELVERYGPQDPARAVHVAAQVASALAEAHEVGLIHRDVKPANVFVGRQGGVPDFVKVLDFGLVKDTGRANAALSHANFIAGTPLYMAPESITAPDSIDARVDVYALGAVLYWLLTATSPFQGSSLIEICSHHLHTPVEPPSQRLGRDLPASVEALVLSCLAKSRDERPRSARALHAALTACLRECPWDDATALRFWDEASRAAGAPREALSVASR